MKSANRSKNICVAVCAGVLLLISKSAVAKPVSDYPLPDSLVGEECGDLVQVERIGQYSALEMRLLVQVASWKIKQLKEFPRVEQGARLYRLSYWTRNPDGSRVIASGLLGIPKRTVPTRTIVYHHGTSARRVSSPSYPGSKLGKFLAMSVSGAGDLLIAPDYIGLGGSEEHHPYLHARSMADSSLDLLRASHTFLTHLRMSWPESLYLAGFSQGGHSTLVVQRALERRHNPLFPVTAAAAISGPVDLRYTSFPNTLSGSTPGHTYYLAYLTTAYSRAYRQPLHSLLREPYASAFPTVFDGHHTKEDILAILPERPIEMFHSHFLTTYKSGGSHWFLDALAANSLLDFTPSAPVRLFYGEKDLDVHPDEARVAARVIRSRGADIQAVSLGELDHGEAMLTGIAKALAWFREPEQSPGK
ncbi:MAG: hypothetical protein AAF733_12540 [Verrucomicrobiota bacterium]